MAVLSKTLIKRLMMRIIAKRILLAETGIVIPIQARCLSLEAVLLWLASLSRTRY
jgi:hypothetical protein